MPYYIHTVVTLKLGEIEAYSEMMAKLTPYMARNGWKLILGLQPFVGDFTELLHVWEVERFEDVERGLLACQTDPEAWEILAPMPKLLHNEALKIMAKTSYSP